MNLGKTYVSNQICECGEVNDIRYCDSCYQPKCPRCQSFDMPKCKDCLDMVYNRMRDKE